jgi:diguanylate cyclase (GGDEF) domain
MRHERRSAPPIDLGLLFRQFSAIAAGSVVVIGVAVLIGWALGNESLMTVLPGHIRMKSSTAVAFLAAAAALLGESLGIQPRFRRLLGLVPLLLGGATLVEYFSGISLHIDQMFFLDPVQKMYPGRMAHLTAGNFVLLGVALLCRTSSRNEKRASAALALVVATSSLLAIVGYIYGVPVLYGSIQYTAMAIHTGISFLLLSLATVFVDPLAPVANIFGSREAGGVVARRLVPLAIVLPMILGRIFSSPSFNFREPRMGMALQVMASVMVFSISIAYVCRSLNRALEGKHAAEKTLEIDGLTGIFNRWYFDRRLVQEMERSRRYGPSLSLVLFDVDHFKKINDEHGHVVGDEVLRAIGVAAAQTLRESDAVCRYGGEEFVLILPETSVGEAALVAERVRAEIARGVEARVGFAVTVSLGATAMTANDQHPTDMIARADYALYEAKASGRDCVRIGLPGPREVHRHPVATPLPVRLAAAS